MRDAPKGYTDKFLSLLTFRYTKAEGFGGPGDNYRPFDGLTPDDLGTILAKAPHLADQTQNDSPRMAEFLALGRKYPDIRFHGYLIAPEREDERISIEGWTGPTTRHICKAEHLQPDELSDTRAWWD